MEPTDLRIALFSGNYNYVRDGANQALNRLVGYLLKRGAKVRIYSPVVDSPAFPATGEMVDVPSFSIPTRKEYRVPSRFEGRPREDLEAFAPNVIHVASPDIVAHRAVTWARAHGVPVVASVHTRFETYMQYYRLQWLEPVIRAILRRFYHRCDAIVAPAESTAAILRAQRMARDISLWTRGVDRDQFNPERRSMEWRRARGIGDDDLLIVFLGRVVMEKGLDIFAAAMGELGRRGVEHKVLVIGEGPARTAFARDLPDAIFTGQLTGDDLAQAVASGDVLLNPSVTEAFGNVTLEAMACGLPVVAASASGTTNLVRHGETGMLVPPKDVAAYADALEAYARDPELRARHGAAGLDYARTMDWDRINDAVLQVYLRVVGKRKRS
ncbi:glycosyltransferase family 4 protein [Sphingomonas mesophila]|uniref:glycosyltransferase family 4 protein n=1 Tax=Sphingomonas mesophila TaxID=2303576 RepID=UPI000E59155C|nr:glycosyltransferase family 1 protein [Sphingomonas mesophila]